jgi:hypothetical protein
VVEFNRHVVWQFNRNCYNRTEEVVEKLWNDNVTCFMGKRIGADVMKNFLDKIVVSDWRGM